MHQYCCSIRICILISSILDVYYMYVSSLHKHTLNPDYRNRFSQETGYAINAVLPRGRGIISVCNFCGTRAAWSTHAYCVIISKFYINIYLHVFLCVYYIITGVVEIKQVLNTHRSKVSLIMHYNDVILLGRYPHLKNLIILIGIPSIF